MFQNLGITLDSPWTPIGIAQIPVSSEAFTPEEAAFVFSGPQFFIALLAGVMMALAFQLLLTNFSVALGISSLGGSQSASDNEAESLGGTIRKIETSVGIWTLVTVTIALFIACLLAVKLSLVDSTLLGAIIGVAIWATYFSLLVWLGSTAVGSLIGSVMSTATSGFQGLMGTATAALGANVARNQAVSTAEEITAAVRRELTSGLDSSTIQKTLQNSLASVQLPSFDLKEIRGQFENILNNSDLKSIADSDLLRNIDRQTFVDLVSSRTDLSKQDVNQIADQLESVWQQVVGKDKQNEPQSQVLNLLKSATPEELKSSDLGARLEQLISSGQNTGKQSNGAVNQAMQAGVSALTTALLQRVDLSDVDVERISGQLQKLTGKATEQANKLGTQVAENLPQLPHNTIKADVENYILSSFPWHFNRITLKDEFKEVIYDPNGDPGAIRRQIEQLNQEYFAQRLGQRGDISAAKVKEIAGLMEDVRQEVLDVVQKSQEREQGQDLRNRVENYLRSTGKEELNPEGIQRDFQTLLEDPEAGFDAVRGRLSQFDRDTLVQLLKERQDISSEEADKIISQLESVRDSVINRAKELQEQAQARALELRQKVEEYLRNTNKEELNPEGIKRDLRTLLDDPQAGISLLRLRLSQFDRDTLVKLLSQREDLSEEEVNQILNSIEEVRDNILQTPQKLALQAKEQYEKTTSAIAEYLRNTNLEELNPEGIQRDLTKLLDDPQQGALALRNRLSQVDRETLVKLLSQRQDLSQEQVNQIIDEVQEAIRGIVRAPRRLASRATKQVLDFEANLENYLRHTNKEELNPEAIKRDLQLLLKDPRAGLGSIGDRVISFDRSTLVALLSQREDITQEEANRIADQIESVRNSFVEQVQKVQQTIQSALDGIFARIRDYLNSLERPELNYEGIKQDFQTLFDDPQAGLQALRDRLSQFDRDTLVAVLSSREDISQADANRIIDSIEASRDSVLQRVERIQQEAQKRIEALKQQALWQAEETKKAVAGAAWWLFSTALTSLAASAIAGAIAVAGLDLFG